MAGPSKLFCSIAERQYNTTIATIESGLFLPIFVLRQLKARIKQYENLVIYFNEKVLEELLDLFLQMIDIRKIKGFENAEEARLSFCAAAWACKAVKDTMFPPGGDPDDDPIYVKMIPVETRNILRGDGDQQEAFELFSKYVCRLSLRGILESFIDDYLLWMQEKLDEILEALGINKLDEWIEDYVVAIAPILKLLEDLDRFADCAFKTCNFTATALNKTGNTSTTLSMTRRATGWTFVADEYIQSIYTREDVLRQNISDLRTKISQIDFTPDSGVQPDEIVK